VVPPRVVVVPDTAIGKLWPRTVTVHESTTARVAIDRASVSVTVQ
jgi:hypothetical protein